MMRPERQPRNIFGNKTEGLYPYDYQYQIFVKRHRSSTKVVKWSTSRKNNDVRYATNLFTGFGLFRVRVVRGLEHQTQVFLCL